MDAKLIILIICGVVVFITLMRVGIHLEKKGFNNGECIVCGTKLRHFDNDSQGGRGYVCDKCGYYTWVSYPSVDKKFLEGAK